MANTPARFKEVDLRRALRVAASESEPGRLWAVEITFDGTIRLVPHLGLTASPKSDWLPEPEPEEEIIL